MFSFGSRRSLIGLTLVTIIGLAGVVASGYHLISQSATTVANESAEDVSVAWRNYISRNISDINGIVYRSDLRETVSFVVSGFDLFPKIFRFVLFDSEGRPVIEYNGENVTISKPEDQVVNEIARTVLLDRSTRSEIFHNEAGPEHKPNLPDHYVETFVPIIRRGFPVGVILVDVDQSERLASLSREYASVGVTLAALVLITLLIPGIWLVWMLKNMQRRNQLLAEARDDALTAERAKSQFLANMSHEIRTPMNGVLGMSELLCKTELTERQRMFAELIQTSGRSLLAIINDILDFSKIDAGQVKLSDALFRTEDVAYEPARMLSAIATRKGVEILVRIDPDLPQFVKGDLGRLQQVSTNFLSNAVKFTEKGQVFIEVLVDDDSSDTQVVARIQVHDTGIGIPQDKLATVFDKFSQVDNSMTRKHQGTGLGLAICKGLIELMGGSIGATSQVGLGSTFWFTVPLTRVPEATTMRERSPAVDIVGKRVLIVDDNETNRFILREMMTSWNMDVSAAPSGQEGILAMHAAQQSRHPFDLVILDHQMPAMSGDEVARAIRGEPSLAHIPIIMLSSIDELPSGDDPQSALIDAFASKPVAAPQLLERVVEVMSAAADGLLASQGSGASPMIRPTFHEPLDARQISEIPPEDSDTAANGSDTGSSVTEINRSRRPKLLIVEDNPVNLLLAQQYLDHLDVPYASAENGAEALAAFSRVRPSVILMDISMPVMNGYDATRRIREIESEMNIKPSHIVGLTAHVLPEDRDRCFAAGMNDFIGKPVSEASLRKGLEIAGLLQPIEEQSDDEEATRQAG